MKSFTFIVRRALVSAGFHEARPDSPAAGFFLSEKAGPSPAVEIYFVGIAQPAEG